MDAVTINDNVTIGSAALSWRAVRSSGPGGQHANKVATRVELSFDPGRSALPESALGRLQAGAPHLFDGEGRLRLVCQQTRSQRRNLNIALERLVVLLRGACIEPVQREPTLRPATIDARRLEAKRRRSCKKKLRRGPESGDD